MLRDHNVCNRIYPFFIFLAVELLVLGVAFVFFGFFIFKALNI